jgi:hypothetical protein
MPFIKGLFNWLFNFGSEESQPEIESNKSDLVSHSISVRGFSVPKLEELVETNADAFLFDIEKGIVAVSDGVSRSYRPELWSRALVTSICRSGLPMTDERIVQLASELEIEPQDDDAWYTAELRSKGSHATLISAHLVRQEMNDVVELTSVGDCCAFLVRNELLVDSWPYRHRDDFPARPHAISSIGKNGLGDQVSTQWKVSYGDRLLLATDAISRFAVTALNRNPLISVSELFPFLDVENGQEEIFNEWANESRMATAVEDDDLTIVEIQI